MAVITGTLYDEGGAVLNVKAFGAVGNGSTPDTQAFQDAIDAGVSAGMSIYVPPGFYLIEAPLVFPYNSGPKLIGATGLKQTVLVFHLLTDFESRGAIEYKHDATNQPNFAGCTLKNLRITGTTGTDISVCHGVYLQDVSYPLMENVLIDGFRGAGLLIDKCQDGSFRNVSIQGCGRTLDGDYSEAHTTNNANTAYAALHLLTTIANDHPNMLRFVDCQIEQNAVSPYIRCDSTLPIGMVFENLHAEVRTSPAGTYDLFEIAGGEWAFSGIAATLFRNGFIFKGYGTLRFANCRSIGNVVGPDTTTGQFEMVNVSGGNISWSSFGGSSKFTNCTLGDVTIHWPSGGPSFFINCVLGNVSIDNTGAGDAGVRFLQCSMASYTTAASATKQWLKDSIVTGNVNAAATDSRIENNVVGGSTTANKIESSYIPIRKTIYDTAPPSFGTWAVGDLVWHSTPAAGGNLGWICVGAGSPGTWKPFGIIAS